MFYYYQVDNNFNGFYKLVLYSREFGETNISFQIVVVDESLTTQTPVSTGYNAASTNFKAPSNASGLSIGAVIAIAGSLVAVVLLPLLVAISVYLTKKKKDSPGKIYFSAFV